MLESLLIVGASVRAAAWSAVRAGLRPVAADRFADVDLGQLCVATRIEDYPSGLVDFFRTAPRCGWMYTGGLENEPELVQRLTALRTLYGNPPAVLRSVRDPHRLTAALADRRLPILALREGSEVVPGDGTWMRKSRRSTGGLGVAIWHGPRHQDPAPEGDVFFQQRVWGEPVAGLFVAASGRCQLLGLARQLIGLPWTGARDFHYAGSVGPLDVPPQVVDQFRQIGAALTDRFDLVGLFGVDAILRDGQVWTVEVNPRYTASVEILERALALPAVALHLAACRGLPLPAASDQQPGVLWGKAVLFARRHVKVPPILARKLARAAGGGGRWKVADVPRPGESIRRGRPITTVLAHGANRREVIGRLKTGLAQIERQLDG